MSDTKSTDRNGRRDTPARFSPSKPMFQNASIKIEVDANSKWLPVTKDAHPTMFAGDDWPAQVAAYNLAAPVLLHRRFVTSHAHRLHIASDLAGGTSPGFAISIRSISVGG